MVSSMLLFCMVVNCQIFSWHILPFPLRSRHSFCQLLLSPLWVSLELFGFWCFQHCGQECFVFYSMFTCLSLSPLCPLSACICLCLPVSVHVPPQLHYGQEQHGEALRGQPGSRHHPGGAVGHLWGVRPSGQLQRSPTVRLRTPTGRL